jgi:hypothetical protein
MTTATDTEIDEATKSELQPPCEAVTVLFGVTQIKCTSPATWVVRAACRACDVRVTKLLCQSDMAFWAGCGPVQCLCGAVRPAQPLSIEPIR